MKTILIGNGFNVHLGGSDYSNKAIINRLIENTNNKDYSSTLFANKISNTENAQLLPGFFNELQSILNGDYDKYCRNDNEHNLIALLKERYSETSKIDDVGMEDYFVILKLFHLRFDDPIDIIKSTHDGLCWEFLDAIYNEGEIQKITETMEEDYKEFLKERFSTYDEIFTVNYDKNIEMISGCQVKHLHGDFETLLDQYDESTPIGAYYKKIGKPNPASKSNSHIYSNCIMGFSGVYKEHIIDVMDNGQLGADSILLKYNCGLISDEKLSELKKSKNDNDRLAFGIIEAVIDNPSLKMHTYPMKDFKNISGEIHLLGISPSNDEHIWDSILKNSQITKIVFYYNSERSRKTIEGMFNDKRIECVSKDLFWF